MRHLNYFDFRFDSYYNYCKLFNYILSAEQPVNLELPNQWLWEIIDEFIYQFQAFSQFRSKLSKKSDEEIDILKSNPKVIEDKSIPLSLQLFSGLECSLRAECAPLPGGQVQH